MERHHQSWREDGERGFELVVPKITVIVGGSFGAGHYAMCGKAFDPRFLFAWPTSRYAVMSGDSAAGTLVEIK